MQQLVKVLSLEGDSMNTKVGLLWVDPQILHHHQLTAVNLSYSVMLYTKRY